MGSFAEEGPRLALLPAVSSFVCHKVLDSDLPPPTLLKGNLSQGGGNCANFQINLRGVVKSIVGKSSPLHAAEPPFLGLAF